MSELYEVEIIPIMISRDTCYCCEELFSPSNTSKEHIIPNSIGGRWKSKTLLCRQCNSEIGEKADAEFANEFNYFINFLNIQRERKTNAPPLKNVLGDDGKLYNVGQGFKISLAKPLETFSTKDGIKYRQIEVVGSQQQVDKFAKQLRESNAKIGIPPHLTTIRQEKAKLPRLRFEISVGSALSQRSMVKTAVNFYVESTGDSSAIQHLVSYIKGNEEGQYCQLYCPSEPFYLEAGDEVVHTLHLVADAQKNTLYCFLDFFSSISYVVVLSKSYSGTSFSKTFAYNVLEHREIERIIDWELDVRVSIGNNADNVQRMTPRMQRVQDIAIQSTSISEGKKHISTKLELIREQVKQGTLTYERYHYELDLLIKEVFHLYPYINQVKVDHITFDESDQQNLKSILMKIHNAECDSVPEALMGIEEYPPSYDYRNFLFKVYQDHIVKEGWCEVTNNGQTTQLTENGFNILRITELGKEKLSKL